MNEEGRFRFKKYTPKNSTNFIITFEDMFELKEQKGFEFDRLKKTFNSLDMTLLRNFPNIFFSGFEEINIEAYDYSNPTEDYKTQFICHDPFMMQNIGMFLPGVEPHRALVEFVDTFPNIRCRVSMNMFIYYDIDMFRKNQTQAEDVVIDSLQMYLSALSIIYNECFKTSLVEQDSFNANYSATRKYMLEDMENKPGIYLLSSNKTTPPKTTPPTHKITGGPQLYQLEEINKKQIKTSS